MAGKSEYDSIKKAKTCILYTWVGDVEGSRIIV